MLGHVLDEVFETRVGEAVFVRPARVVKAREDAAERGLVRLLDGEHRFRQPVADVLRRTPHVAPMAAVWDGEEVHFGERGIFLVAAGFRESRVVFFIPVVGNAFVEQERRDVGLVLVLIDRPAHDVARLEEPAVELLAREFLFVHADVKPPQKVSASLFRFPFLVALCFQVFLRAYGISRRERAALRAGCAESALAPDPCGRGF